MVRSDFYEDIFENDFGRSSVLQERIFLILSIIFY